jgi:signal recognition particle receptor subunit beta
MTSPRPKQMDEVNISLLGYFGAGKTALVKQVHDLALLSTSAAYEIGLSSLKASFWVRSQPLLRDDA